MIIRMVGLSCASHWHVHVVQMQWCSHVGIVLSGGAQRYVLVGIKTVL